MSLCLQLEVILPDRTIPDAYLLRQAGLMKAIAAFSGTGVPCYAEASYAMVLLGRQGLRPGPFRSDASARIKPGLATHLTAERFNLGRLVAIRDGMRTAGAAWHSSADTTQQSSP